MAANISAGAAGENAAPAQDRGQKRRKGSVLRRVRKRFRLFSIRAGMDLPFFFLLLVLLTIGLVMLFSASYPYAYYNMDGDSYYFIRNQAMYAVLGVTIMIAVSYFDYHHFHKLAIPLLLVTYLLLIAMLVLRGSSFVPNIKGAYRWFYIGPINFQPSEVAKFTLILVFSHLISLNYEKMQTFRYGVVPYAIILGSIAGLVILEKHISATVILVFLGVLMMFIGGTRLRWILLPAIIVGVVAFYLLFFTDVFSYAMPRIYGWLFPFESAGGDRYLADAPVAHDNRLRWPLGAWPRPVPPEISLSAGTPERLYLSRHLRGAGLHRRADHPAAVCHAHLARCGRFAQSKG